MCKAENIRLIKALSSSTILEIDGKLQIMPQDSGPEKPLDFPAASSIVDFFGLSGRMELGFTTKEGGLWTLNYLVSGH